MATVQMGVPDRVFWRLQLRQLMAMMKSYNLAQQRADNRFGQLAALIANANRDPKRRRKPFVPGDFFPSLVTTPISQTEHMISMARGLVEAKGWGRVTTRAEREAEAAAREAAARLNGAGAAT